MSKKTDKNICPFCGGALQATVKVDCDLSANGTIIRSGTGGDFRLYCENDCDEWEGHDGTDHSGWPTRADVAEYLAQLPEPGAKREGDR
jgi:hypothetical protein